MRERMKAAKIAAEPYVQPKLESYAEPASKSRCVVMRVLRLILSRGGLLRGDGTGDEHRG